MSLSTRAFAGFVLIASAIVLGTALLSQYWGGLVPCELCLLQRWPWAAAIVISLVLVLVGERARLDWVALVLGLVFATSVVLAFIMSALSSTGSPARAPAPPPPAVRRHSNR